MRKPPKRKAIRQQETRAQNTKKFFAIVAVSTLVLLVMLYLVYSRV